MTDKWWVHYVHSCFADLFGFSWHMSRSSITWLIPHSQERCLAHSLRAVLSTWPERAVLMSHRAGHGCCTCCSFTALKENEHHKSYTTFKNRQQACSSLVLSLFCNLQIIPFWTAIPSLWIGVHVLQNVKIKISLGWEVDLTHFLIQKRVQIQNTWACHVFREALSNRWNFLL